MTSRDARSRRIGLVGALAASAVFVAATSVWAQFDSSRQRLRNLTANGGGNTAQQKQKLDDVLDKVNDTEDHERRLQGLGELAFVSPDDRAKAIGYLLAAANDPDASVRVKSITTLGLMQAQEAVAPMVQRLFMRDTDLQTRRHILAALGQIGDKRATKPILDFLLHKDVDRDTRGTAIYALGEIGDEAALEPLSQIAKAEGEPTLGNIARTAAHKIQHRPAPDVTPPALLTEADRRQQAEQAQAAAAQGN